MSHYEDESYDHEKHMKVKFIFISSFPAQSTIERHPDANQDDRQTSENFESKQWQVGDHLEVR